MNQLYDQYFGHTTGHIGFITNNMTSFLSAVKSYSIFEHTEGGVNSTETSSRSTTTTYPNTIANIQQ